MTIAVLIGLKHLDEAKSRLAPELSADQRRALMRAMLTEGPDAYVASAMDRNPRRFSPDTPLSEVLADLSGARGCALVMDGEKLVGLLTSENVSAFILLRQVSIQQQARTHSR